MPQRFFAAFCSLLLAAAPAAAECQGAFAVEILGSGGPRADDGRAGAGYLVWADGEAKFLIDAGGGVFLRFAEVGAKVGDLDGIFISHFHADHAGDLVPILKSGFFERRREPLAIAGPSGGAFFPGLMDWLSATFDAERGAWRYLSGYLNGRGGLPKLEPTEVDVGDDKAAVVYEDKKFTVTALPVVHGPVPALGFVVKRAGVEAVFAGDQGIESEFFDSALKDSRPDLLIAHHAIPEADGGQPILLHRPPSSIGQMAASLGAKKLVLSHNMLRALNEIDKGRAAIAEHYDGPVDVAEDHTCYAMSDSK
ncbi:MAG: MBL fold metallo-hydrolase [Parvularculaceae bacterium]